MGQMTWHDHMWTWATSPEGITTGDYVEIIHDRYAGRHEITTPSRWQQLLAHMGLTRIYPQHTNYTGMRGHVVRLGYYPHSTECGIVFDDNPTLCVNGWSCRNDIRKIER